PPAPGARAKAPGAPLSRVPSHRRTRPPRRPASRASRGARAGRAPGVESLVTSSVRLYLEGSMLIVLAALTVVGAVIGSPAEALAWGPVTHLVHGSMLLERLNLLPVALQGLLARFPYEYLYGCIGADIIQAKKFTRSLYTHCHHWHTGWSVLENAHEDAE